MHGPVRTAGANPRMVQQTAKMMIWPEPSQPAWGRMQVWILANSVANYARWQITTLGAATERGTSGLKLVSNLGVGRGAVGKVIRMPVCGSFEQEMQHRRAQRR